MLNRIKITSFALLILGLSSACRHEDEKAPSAVLASSCNHKELEICINAKGGEACYPKWNCTKADVQQASSTTGQPEVGVAPSTAKTFNARGTGYYPDSSALQGGFVDRRGKPLQTLQAFLDGKAPYVSVAMDLNSFPYGTSMRILELEKKYKRIIEFRVVDTGGAFKGKGTTRIDICTANQAASVESTINGPLTLVVE